MRLPSFTCIIVYMKTAVKTKTTTTLSVSDIDSEAISSFRFMGDYQFGTMEVTFQSGAVYRYHEVPYITVLTMATWVNGENSLGWYFNKFVRSAYRYELVA